MKMGDVINKLPIDDKLEITPTDKSNLLKFFNADIAQWSASATTTTMGSNRDALFAMTKFVLLLTLLYYICSHPASVGRFVEHPTYKLLLQTLMFGLVLCIYMYFFNY